MESRGWRLARVNGSHHIYVLEGNSLRLSIPIHGDRPLGSGLLGHMLKQAGIPIEDIRALTGGTAALGEGSDVPELVGEAAG